jgi:hypothetical protein
LTNHFRESPLRRKKTHHDSKCISPIRIQSLNNNGHAAKSPVSLRESKEEEAKALVYQPQFATFTSRKISNCGVHTDLLTPVKVGNRYMHATQIFTGIKGDQGDIRKDAQRLGSPIRLVGEIVVKNHGNQGQPSITMSPELKDSKLSTVGGGPIRVSGSIKLRNQHDAAVKLMRVGCLSPFKLQQIN